MRKIILTKFFFCAPEDAQKDHSSRRQWEEYRQVVVNHNPGETRADLSAKANELLREWFKTEYAESHLLASVAFPTIGAEDEKESKSNLLFTNWNTFKEIPALTADGEMSEDVLIDVDGNRKTFRVGFCDIEHETNKATWTLYDQDEEIDLKHMKWTNLPLNKE
jgi:hypothetical protein